MSELKTVVSIMFVFIMMLSALAYGLYLDNNHYQAKIDFCNKILTCEKFSCLAENSKLINIENNYLLKEQNCLLKEKLN